ncbi:hypothetical protein GCM10023194_73940 [Planotetraspora phitsanulokensis]|uniref:Uncharacterized protein n=1 Tax=Planotetraspora phitsanulokensis TaxID=575192 RepID=A0A8J3U4Z5_9ACTN|nr:hypothetical protein [Planotetraspora phitsanulokensis]GII37107.1 hypothetical protein Pph01_21100 [Planotetraspora phitsanulokensis]
MANYDNHRERAMLRRIVLGLVALALIVISGTDIKDLWWVPRFGTEALATVTQIDPKTIQVRFTVDERTYTAFANEYEALPTEVGDMIIIRYLIPAEGIVWDTRLSRPTLQLFFAGFWGLVGLGVAAGVVMEFTGRTLWWERLSKL